MFSDAQTLSSHITDRDNLKFYYGHEMAEKTTGLLQFYKNKNPAAIMKDNCSSLCMLEVPAYISCPELIRFIAPTTNHIVKTKIIRDNMPNIYYVLMNFATPTDCFNFYFEFNGINFNSMEPAKCELLFVEKIETTIEDADGGELPMDSLNESPTCAVCLERLDDCILTILCNHSFHAECLQQCQEFICPVCRFHQTPELLPDQTCAECGRTSDLWMCLICGNIGCGRYAEGHAYHHFNATSHTFTLRLGKNLVWDYAGDNFVHRLIQSSTDGKMVEVQGGNEEASSARMRIGLYERFQQKKEDLDAVKIEWSCLLTSQLETQRLYFEDRLKDVETQRAEYAEASTSQISDLKQQVATLTSECRELRENFTSTSAEKTHLEKKVQKSTQLIKTLQSQLADEKQISSLACNDKMALAARNVELEKKRTEETKALEEQITDLMAHFEAQAQFEKNAAQMNVSVEELQQGSICTEQKAQRKRGAKHK